MDNRYVRTQAMEVVVVSQADPVAEWSSPGGQTGLEGESTFTDFAFILQFRVILLLCLL